MEAGIYINQQATSVHLEAGSSEEFHCICFDISTNFWIELTVFCKQTLPSSLWINFIPGKPEKISHFPNS